MFRVVLIFEMMVRPVSWTTELSDWMLEHIHGMDIRVGSVGYLWLVG